MTTRDELMTHFKLTLLLPVNLMKLFIKFAVSKRVNS